MIIGFKTGPKNWEIAKKIVEDDGAKMCEVWFNVSKEKEYENMFAWLREHRVQIGLHYWGLVGGQYKPNLAHQNQAVRDGTMAQIQRTIEIGKDIGAVYVNVHPGARWLEAIDFARDWQERVEDSETPREVAWQLLSETVQELANFARQRGVLFTLETLPGREANNMSMREGIYDSGNPPLSVMAELGKREIFLANDITHSASQLMVQEQDQETVYRALLDFTRAIAAWTRLLHVNTIQPPFDGRDSHSGVLPENFALGNFPNREQLLELLGQFRERPDVFAVAEPETEKTRENYRALLALERDGRDKKSTD